MQSQTEEEKEKLYPETACIIRLCKLLFFGGVPKKNISLWGNSHAQSAWQCQI